MPAEEGDVPVAPARAPRPRQRRPRQPRIHVPATDLGDPEADGDSPPAVAPAPEELITATESPDGVDAADGNGGAPVTVDVKKRTRRGSRGGRNRRKKPAAAVAGDGAVEAAEPGAGEDDTPAEPVAAPVAPAASGDEGYVPMSEWLEDFKS